MEKNNAKEMDTRYFMLVIIDSGLQFMKNGGLIKIKAASPKASCKITIHDLINETIKKSTCESDANIIIISSRTTAHNSILLFSSMGRRKDNEPYHLLL